MKREELKSMFDALRNDPQHHLGLGDIRLTIAQQDEILAMISPLPPAEGADDLKQYMTNLLYSAYDKGAKQVEPSESDRKDLDQWVEEMINGIDEYFKSKQLTAEGAEEILKRHCKENKIILTSNDFHTWLNAINEIATLHAQRLAEKMVEEKLREFMQYLYVSDHLKNLYMEIDDIINNYLKEVSHD